MAWNDPENGKDRWKKNGGPPNDLDRIVQGWQRKLASIFGGGTRRSGGSAGAGGAGASGVWLLVGLLVTGWALTGLYRVDEAERGVVQRFGAYSKTAMPGLHWHIPFPVETVDIVNVAEVAFYSFNTEMLTADEQYLFIEMVVQYRRTDPVKYLFEVTDPDETLREVTESALREVVGTNTMADLVSEQRDQIAPRTRQLLQTTLDQYGAGISVTSLSLEALDYPSAVQQAVDDTQKARNDHDRYILEADTYAQRLIPVARGEAQRIIQDAEGYRERVIAQAEGDAARFEAVLAEYRQAPEVTRRRMYIDALEQVYGNSNLVIIDTEGTGNLLYLPIERLLEQAGTRSPGLTVEGRSRAASQGTDQSDQASRERRPERRTRQ
ncbi:MAG TPA: FtsH protease activity modulator HflK [Woeseiaceae bacterium]|nr:FtsH protease activity modulator HflK [Woeseiaceae bacterium]